jgi:5-methyltetrahydrofolate--homocysteine methyltransferase
MDTVLTGKSGKQVIIGKGRPTVLIGERINPSGGARKKLTRALVERDAAYLQAEALSQIEAGADILDINIQAADVTDEPDTLAWAIATVAEVVDVPFSIDTNNPEALKVALQSVPGRPLVNSVNGEASSIEQVLPLVAEHHCAVIGLAMDDAGIPPTAAGRVEVARRLAQRAKEHGIAPEDILIDTLTLTVGADHRAAWIALEAMEMVVNELGMNLTAGASNVSFGLPRRPIINAAYLPMAIAQGLNSAIVDADKVRSIIRAADLLAGRDEHAARFLDDYRRELKSNPNQTG